MTQAAYQLRLSYQAALTLGLRGRLDMRSVPEVNREHRMAHAVTVKSLKAEMARRGLEWRAD